MAEGTTIVRGTNDKPVASDRLAKFFESAGGLSGYLFIGYPIIGTSDGRYPVDALYVSPSRGIVVFDLVDGTSVADYEGRQDEAATSLQSRLLAHRELIYRRQLAIEIHTITYAPAIGQRVLGAQGNDYKLANDDNLRVELDDFSWPSADEQMYRRTLSALQNISTIRKSSGRRIAKDNSRGAKMQSLEESIATLDNTQAKAVIETVEGVQRIRGLAGSGKTIVLALKAAYLHAQHPDWKIAVTFSTRSLKPQFRRLINSFSVEQGNEEPNWENVQVVNAWGAPGGTSRTGIYYQFCVDNGIEYVDYNTAKYRYGRDDAFGGACVAALSEVPRPVENYDAILVDEAQDFPPEFLRLCFAMLTPEKRLVYAYDELQNLSTSGLPSATEIFGVKSDGSPLVSFEESSYDLGARRDIILEKCYRNSRPVLVTAHALGFGTNRRSSDPGRTGLVQMFDQPALWQEIGYRVKSGELREGSDVVLERTAETSPPFLEEHSSTDDLLIFGAFSNQVEQAAWVADQIAINLNKDELRYEDIVVINPQPLTARQNLGHVRRALLERGIPSHVAGVDTTADVFFKPGLESITCTGIYRAKGNEAGMVYIIDADECYGGSLNLARARNMLFTAITRSKAWVRVLGVGSNMSSLISEYHAVRDAQFELRFRYPTRAEQAKLKVVHRDMTKEEATALQNRRTSLSELVADIEAGRIFVEDLDEDVRVKLGRIFGGNSE